MRSARRTTRVVGLGIVATVAVAVLLGTFRSHVQTAVTHAWLRPSAVHVAGLSDLDGTSVNWLVVASDRRPEGTDLNRLGHKSGERADAIAVVAIDPTGGQPTHVVRISRELMTDSAQYGRQRIAGLLSYGPTAVVDVLREEASMPIHRYLQLDMPGVVAAVNAMGGVAVDVGTAVRDPAAGLSLAAGRQVLSGDDALALARSRNPQTWISGRWVVEDLGDPARMERQDALVHNTLRELSALSWLQALRVLYAAAPWIHVDHSANTDDLAVLWRGLLTGQATIHTVVTRATRAPGEDVSPFPPSHGATVPSRLAEPDLSDQLASIVAGHPLAEDE